MRNPTLLNEAQLAKFVEGFNALIQDIDPMKRDRSESVKANGIDFARTIILHKQALQIQNARKVVGRITTKTNMTDLLADWVVAATYLGYTDQLETN